MDEYPSKHVRSFVANNEESIRKEAIKYAQHMNRNYSGGTTTFVKVMNKEEAEAHIKEICAYEDQHPQEDSETWKQEMWDLYNKCYNENN
jgi:hypothetical protein